MWKAGDYLLPLPTLRLRARLESGEIDVYGAASRAAAVRTFHQLWHFRMSKKESINLAKLVRDERQKWQDDNLLASGSFRDFHKLCDEAFHSLRGKYYRAADLVAEMRLRRRLRIKVPRKTGHAQKIDVSASEVCEHQ